MVMVYCYNHRTYGHICSECAACLHDTGESALPYEMVSKLRNMCGCCRQDFTPFQVRRRRHEQRFCLDCKTDLEKALGPRNKVEGAGHPAWTSIYLVEIGSDHRQQLAYMVCPRCEKTWACHNNHDTDALLRSIDTLLGK